LLHDAQSSSNLHLLLLSVYQRWTKYFRLLEEIEPLRRRYVQSGEGKVFIEVHKVNMSTQPSTLRGMKK